MLDDNSRPKLRAYLDVGRDVSGWFQPTAMAKIPAGAKDARHATKGPEEGEEDTR